MDTAWTPRRAQFIGGVVELLQFLFDRGEIRVEIDKQPIDRRIDHLYSLGFSQSNDLFASAQQHSFNLIRCEYDPHKQRRLCKYLIETFVEEAQKAADATEESELPERLKLFFGRYEWSYALAMLTSSLKHHGFNEEKEWRLVSQYPGEALYGVSFRPGRFGVTPYFELPLQMNKGVRRLEEVIIGPTANRAAAKAALTILLEKYDTEAKSIKVSGTPLR